MQLTSLMLDYLGVARSVIEKGHIVVPAWRIETVEGTYLVLTHFHDDQPKERERLVKLVARFMAWKMATSFVLAAQTWLEPLRKGGEALIVVGLSRNERFGVAQRIVRDEGLQFGPVQWLMPAQLDEAYFRLLPQASTTLTHTEVAELDFIFGPGGELEADKLY